MSELLKNEAFVLSAMAAIIFVITQFLKMPIKFFSKHICFKDDVAKTERVRKMINATILLIPFGLGILAEFLYAVLYLHVAFSALNGIGYGTAAISFYGIIERFFKVKLPNPYEETEEGKAVVELAKNVVADNKVDKKDIDPVKAFWKKVK